MSFERRYRRIPSGKLRITSVLKKLQLPRRQGDLWGNGAADFDLSKSKGFIFHAERYQLTQPPCIVDPRDQLAQVQQHAQENMPPQSDTPTTPSQAIIPVITRTPDLFIGTNQERLQAEIDYMESMRTARRKREVVPHREPINLAMGGRQVMFFERMDIMGEIQKLKTIALPVRAKELFVGRGFRLPPNHALNNPKKPREITSSDGKPVGKRRGSRFNCDYASFNAPTTQSVPEFNGNTTDSDSLVMVGDSLSQGKSQGFKIYQGSRKGPRLLDLAKSQDPSSNRSNYALNAKQSDLNINDY